METREYYESNRGVILKGFELRGFQNAGLDGIYEVKREPVYMINGTCHRTGVPHPTPTYWNRNSPLDNPVFMYWQYYKDHYSVCPMFDGQRANMWDQVKQGNTGANGPGLAFFRWEENEWLEFDGRLSTFVRQNIIFNSFGPEDALPRRSLIPATPSLVTTRGRMPTSRTPPPQRLIPGTPGMSSSAPRTPVAAHVPQPATQGGFRAPQTPPQSGQQGFVPAAASAAALVPAKKVVSSDSDPALAQEMLRYKGGQSDSYDNSKRQKLLPKKEDLMTKKEEEEDLFEVAEPVYPVSSADGAAAPDTPLYDPDPSLA
eukprot:TRINITY_DN57421_c0_g1_i1.p1 TRINITY_DN57421_c0_g1~~TRINITY_DN57421_c0_g1_i1.p1  ORF type:complete len:315 (+),score=37.81 TRINITY_DN57421_c0_g1_i1:63-1007(+)